MKAIRITQEEEPLQLVEISIPEAQKGECLVKVKAAALNRRDQWIREGRYPGIEFNTTLGSDAVGVVEEGSSTWKGKEVILNPNVNWGDNPSAQSTEYSVLGMPKDGTLAEYIVVNEDRLVEKPDHLTIEEAAAVPLAGLTAYRATIKKGLTSKDKQVLVTGAGGGVSQFSLAFSVALGAKTFVTSGDEAKIQKCIELGAEAGFNYKDEAWTKQARKYGSYDAIVDSAGGNQLNNYLKIVEAGGRIVMYGSTAGYPEKLDTFRLFWSQAQIMGSTMGNDDEFVEMVKFISDHQLRPTIDQVFSIEDYLKAFNQFKAKDHFGKIVINFEA